MKIIILVLSYEDGGGYSYMDDCIKNTWGKYNKDDVEIYYNYAKTLDNTEYYIEENNIYCNGYESYNNIGYKTLKAFKWLVKKDFDYMLRTNTSSFIHINNLKKYLIDKPKNNFYSGSPIPYHTNNLNIDFATGSGYILSKDLVEYIVNHEDKWEHKYPDDVSLGKIMNNNNIKLIPKEWLKLTDIPSSDVVNEIGDKFQIRCKIETLYNVQLQCKIINKLYKLIYEKNII